MEKNLQKSRENSDQTPAPDAAAAAPPPVRSRWTPKPEQILILESIFNSGMVNPPKDETIRIRKLLEKFGPVGDANVFYWFQNRRSRSRRRQRQLQASVTATGGVSVNHQGGGEISPELAAADCYYPLNYWGSSSSGIQGNSNNNNLNTNTNSDLFDFPAMVRALEQNPKFFYEDSSCLPFRQPEVITVFINGVRTEVGSGPMDVKAAFGGDFVVVHSSGAAVPVNEYGFLVDGLRHGESYFLVPRHSLI